MSSQNSLHKIVIVGGGSAGISVAARLLNAGEKDVAVIDPAEVHYYQPLWTLVVCGRARAGQSARAEAAVMPQGATWIREAATEIDPDVQTVSLASGASVGYDFLVVCPGIALDWDRLPGAVLPTPKMFGVPEFSAVLEQVAARYGIDVRLKHEVVEVNPAAKEMVLVNRQGGGEEKSVLPYDIAHLVPPQSAPAWIKAGPLADPRNRMLLAEFDYTMKPHPTIPLIDTKKERYDMAAQAVRAPVYVLETDAQGPGLSPRPGGAC